MKLASGLALLSLLVLVPGVDRPVLAFGEDATYTMKVTVKGMT